LFIFGFTKTVLAHYSRGVRNFLDTEFPNRWIGKKGEIERPTCDHLIYHCLIILWAYLKGKVYATKLRNLEELRRRIIEEVVLIDPEFIRNAVSSFY